MSRSFRQITLTTSARILFLTCAFSLVGTQIIGLPQIAQAQSGAPRPGQYNPDGDAATAISTYTSTDSNSYSSSSPSSQGASASGSTHANSVSQNGPQIKGSRYRALPLTAYDAKQKLDELRLALSVSRPQDVQDGIYELVEWLQDAADAHYRMANAFAKADAKREAAAERQLTSRFGQLKREALLLKSDLLIKERRAPEALTPLVDIVIADPKGATGMAAYKRLQDLGFSQELPSDIANIPAATTGAVSGVKSAAK